MENSDKNDHAAPVVADSINKADELNSDKRSSKYIVLIALFGLIIFVVANLLILKKYDNSVKTSTSQSSSTINDEVTTPIVIEELKTATTLDEQVTTSTESTPQTTIDETSKSTNTLNDVPSNGKRTVWQDNFDSLDTKTWKVENVSSYGDGNNEVQCYMARNTRVTNGQLILTAKNETQKCANDTRQHTSGMIRSRGVTFSPGQGIEFRVKLTPADKKNQGGLWPAVWSSSWAGGGWPNGGELDFIEVMTAKDRDRPVFSMHFAQPNNQHKVINKHKKLNEDFSDNWHTVRFDYGKGGKLKWYLDGEVVHEVTNANTKQGYPAPFNQTIKEIKINLALGGRPGPLDNRALGSKGATFVVDYIKIFNL